MSSEVTILFDAAVYRLSAVKKAAYKWSDRCSIQIEVLDGRRIRVIVRPRATTLEVASATSEFQTEVLDQELREVVAEETAAVRNLLLAEAFSETSLVNPVPPEAGYRSDPMQIARPDRE